MSEEFVQTGVQQPATKQLKSWKAERPPKPVYGKSIDTAIKEFHEHQQKKWLRQKAEADKVAEEEREKKKKPRRQKVTV